jgi:hypothetical protein
MRSFVVILFSLFLVHTAFSVELFRYLAPAEDGGTLEYIFEAEEQNSPNAVSKEKAAEIAADFMTNFHHVQVGALEKQEFRTTPLPFWLIVSRTRSKVHYGNCTSSFSSRMGLLSSQE